LTFQHVVAFVVHAQSESVVRTTSERRPAKPQRPFARQTYGTSSVRPVRTVPLRSSNVTQPLNYQQVMLMKLARQMHRNPLLYNLPSTTTRQPVIAAPIPSDWNTERSMKARRRPVARVDRDDSYIASGESEPDHVSMNTEEAQETLPSPDSETEEPLPTAAMLQSPSSPPPAVTREIRNGRRRRKPVNVDSEDVLVNGADSRPLASENEKPLIDLSTDLSMRKETDVDSILNVSGVQQRQQPAASRPSMIFEKVPVEVVKPATRNRRHLTLGRSPLQESSV